MFFIKPAIILALGAQLILCALTSPVARAQDEWIITIDNSRDIMDDNGWLSAPLGVMSQNYTAIKGIMLRNDDGWTVYIHDPHLDVEHVSMTFQEIYDSVGYGFLTSYKSDMGLYNRWPLAIQTAILKKGWGETKFPDKTAFYSGGQAVWSFEMLTGKKYKEYKPNSVAQLEEILRKCKAENNVVTSVYCAFRTVPEPKGTYGTKMDGGRNYGAIEFKEAVSEGKPSTLVTWNPKGGKDVLGTFHGDLHHEFDVSQKFLDDIETLIYRADQ